MKFGRTIHIDTRQAAGRYNLELFEVDHGDNRYLALSIIILFQYIHCEMFETTQCKNIENCPRNRQFL